MLRPALVRAGATAAIIGGLLRAAASFAPAVDPAGVARESLYLAVDMCLAIALAGFYYIPNTGIAARLGSTVALLGLMAVRLDRALSGGALYSAAALATALGVVALSTSFWVRRTIRAWIPAAFVVSIVLGAVGTLFAGASGVFVWSGVLFGVAFAALGYSTLRSNVSGGS